MTHESHSRIRLEREAKTEGLERNSMVLEGEVGPANIKAPIWKRGECSRGRFMLFESEGYISAIYTLVDTWEMKTLWSGSNKWGSQRTLHVRYWVKSP